jgi:SAM-dependent methyltransferase
MDLMIATNAGRYDTLYADGLCFLRYPAEMVVRFFDGYVREHIPSGRVLDFGCGTGGNMRLFIDEGYETHGLEISPAVLPLARETIGDVGRIHIVAPDTPTLPFPDAHFDVVIANGVLCYLASEERIRAMCDEFARCLRPDGAVYLTMMGPRCNYIAELGRPLGADLYEVPLGDACEFVYVVRDEAHLRALFSRFTPIATGHWDQALFGSRSNFHWIFVGKSPGVEQDV